MRIYAYARERENAAQNVSHYPRVTAPQKPKNYKTLRKNYKTLRKNYKTLRKNYKALRKNYKALRKNYKALSLHK